MIYVIVGYYGSGKTEVALNLALQKQVPTIVDLDIVNPFFRTKDAQEKLASAGIKLISPEFANTNVDMPTVPAEVYSVFQKTGDVIFDVGGDDDGAVALGQYNAFFQEQPYQMYFVINTKRPQTETAKDIIEVLRAVELTSRLKVTGLINNTNIKGDTTAQVLADSAPILQQVVEETGLPLCYTSVMRPLASQISVDSEVLPLDLHLKLPWEDFSY